MVVMGCHRPLYVQAGTLVLKGRPAGGPRLRRAIVQQ